MQSAQGPSSSPGLNLEQLRTLAGIKQENFDTTRISINAKDGSISSVAVDSISTSDTAVKENYDTLRTLEVAAKLLKGGDLDKADKPYTKTAKKVVKFYTEAMGLKSMEKSKKASQETRLANQFNNLSYNIQRQTIRIEHSQKKTAQQAKLAEWGAKYKPPTKEAIATQMSAIENDTGHSSDGQDIFRHLMSGIVSITTKDGDAFEANDVKRSDLAGDEVSDADKSEFLAQRMEVTMNVFKEVVCKNAPPSDSQTLEQEISTLADTIRKGKPDSAGETIAKQMTAWRNGTPTQKNMARLMHTLNQGFHMGPMSQGSLLHLKDRMGDDSPHTVMGMKGTEFKQSGGKAIDITVADDKVTIEHRVHINQTQPAETTVQIRQTVELSASTDDLSSWDYSTNCEVHAGRVEDQPTAQKVFDIYQHTGVPATKSGF